MHGIGVPGRFMCHNTLTIGLIPARVLRTPRRNVNDVGCRSTIARGTSIGGAIGSAGVSPYDRHESNN